MHFSLCGTSVASKIQQGAGKNCAREFLVLSALKLPPCGLVVFIDMTTYITKGKNFKAFLAENYAIALALLWIDVTYLLKNVEHGIEHVDGAYGVCIHLKFLKFTPDSMNTLQVQQMMNFTVKFLIFKAFFTSICL